VDHDANSGGITRIGGCRFRALHDPGRPVGAAHLGGCSPALRRRGRAGRRLYEVSRPRPDVAASTSANRRWTAGSPPGAPVDGVPRRRHYLLLSAGHVVRDMVPP